MEYGREMEWAAVVRRRAAYYALSGRCPGRTEARAQTRMRDGGAGPCMQARAAGAAAAAGTALRRRGPAPDIFRAFRRACGACALSAPLRRPGEGRRRACRVPSASASGKGRHTQNGRRAYTAIDASERNGWRCADAEGARACYTAWACC